MSLEISGCQERHVAALQSYLAQAYGDAYILAVNRSFLGWQFGRQAPQGEYNLKLALLDGEIVGCLGYIPAEVSLAGEVVRGAWLANWIVAGAEQGLGIGPLLMQELMGQFDVIFNVGVNRTARRLLARMRWTDRGELTRYVRILNAEEAAALTGGRPLDDVAWPAPCRTSLRPGLRLHQVEHFRADVTKLWDQMSENSRSAGIRRSADYLNWRYAGHPVFGYRMVEVREGDAELKAVAVFRMEPVREHAMSVCRLVELIGDAEGVDAALPCVVDLAIQDGAVLIDWFTEGDGFGGALERQGFLDARNETAAAVPYLFQPVAQREEGIGVATYFRTPPAGVRHWYITKADADQDRPN